VRVRRKGPSAGVEVNIKGRQHVILDREIMYKSLAVVLVASGQVFQAHKNQK
jgi:hypothetical protein